MAINSTQQRWETLSTNPINSAMQIRRQSLRRLFTFAPGADPPFRFSCTPGRHAETYNSNLLPMTDPLRPVSYTSTSCEPGKERQPFVLHTNLPRSLSNSLLLVRREAP